MVRISQSTRNAESVYRKRNEAYTEACAISNSLKSVVTLLRKESEENLELALKITCMIHLGIEAPMTPCDFFTFSNEFTLAVNSLSTKERLGLIKYLSQVQILLG